MPHPQFDRFAVRMERLATRESKKAIQHDHVSPHTPAPRLPDAAAQIVGELAERIRRARERERPVVVAFGAHVIKNGLGPVLLWFMENGWFTHLATNGAGIIHDWEFAFQGTSCEDVAKMVRDGRFGNWQETGFFINLALNVGAYQARGYGEAIGAMIHKEGLQVPSVALLKEEIRRLIDASPRHCAAAADLAYIVQRFELREGWLNVPHPYKQYSVQAGAYRLGVPLTGHPMIGHDIVYNHPMNHGAAVGRTAQRDFLTYAESIRRIEGGVYISVGSAVMSPMIFEKSLSMARNVALQQGERIDDFFLLVNDLAESSWDWSQGEPPEDNPAYYLRYNKSFSRMGGSMRYLQSDNRDFLLNLLSRLH